MTTTQTPQQTPKLTPPPSFSSIVGVVAKREIMTRVLSKSFVISTVVTLVIMLAAFVFAPRLGDLLEGDAPSVVATKDVASKLDGVPDLEVKEVPDEAAARKAVQTEDADAAIVASDASPTGVKVFTLDSPPGSVMDAISLYPEVEVVQKVAADGSPVDGSNPMVTYFLALGFGIVWMMAAITFGMSIANSVVEEKQTRIVEILLASVTSKALLTGKILGNSAAALVQILLMAGVAFLGMAINGTALPVQNLATPIGWFIVLFLVGFVMIAALYAAAASLVSRTEDLANVQQPIMWLVMLPYMAIIMFSSNPTALTVMSYIPFSAPVAVPMRVFQGQGAVWEPVLSLVLLVAFTVLIIVLAAKIYDNALLRTGKPVKWKDALLGK
ncbi:MAG: ABC transporter permease [Propionibacteriaceae bacterium]|nr:ABC transporter permease [Propionibacteriaceae bacterium]